MPSLCNFRLCRQLAIRQHANTEPFATPWEVSRRGKEKGTTCVSHLFRHNMSELS